jgi:hypothetical protein
LDARWHRAGRRPRKTGLDGIKVNKLFKDSLLLTIGRLSVVSLTEAQHRFLVD